ncbi:MAG: hypothetical protein EZS28_052783, partial [Streblomastix strix]
AQSKDADKDQKGKKTGPGSGEVNQKGVYFEPVELLDVSYVKVLLGAAKYCDPLHTLQKAALPLLSGAVRKLETSQKVLLCSSGILDDLASVLDNKMEKDKSVCFNNIIEQ